MFTTTFCTFGHPFAIRVNSYVTGIDADVRFLKVSLTRFVIPEVGPAGVIPATVALLQLNDVPGVAEVAV